MGFLTENDQNRFKMDVLATLEPVFGTWQGLLTDAELRRELLMAVEGRFRALQKRCSRCRQQLPRDSAFGLNAARPDGLQHECKQCRKAERA